jgi:hypothetical protein
VGYTVTRVSCRPYLIAGVQVLPLALSPAKDLSANGPILLDGAVCLSVEVGAVYLHRAV